MLTILLPNIDPILLKFNLGIVTFDIKKYPLFYITAFIFIFFLFSKFEQIYKITKTKKKDFDCLAIFLVSGVIVGARIGYFIFYNFYYIFKDINNILKIWQGGLSFHGGVIGIFISIILFCCNRKKKILQF